MRIIRLVIILGLAFILSGCNPRPSENGFAIYLTKNAAPAQAGMTAAPVELDGEPIIASGDIVSYNRNTHEMEVSPATVERVKKLKVPTSGRAFAVCLGKEIIYTGAFWTPISSQSFGGVTIMLLLGNETILQLAPGYPSAGFMEGGDPRSNPRIFAALEKVGKLK